MGNGTGGVEGFGDVRDGAGGDDNGSGFRVVFGEETELAERLDSGLFGHGAEFVNQLLYCCCFFHGLSWLLQIWIKCMNVCVSVCVYVSLVSTGRCNRVYVRRNGRPRTFDLCVVWVFPPT